LLWQFFLQQGSSAKPTLTAFLSAIFFVKHAVRKPEPLAKMEKDHQLQHNLEYGTNTNQSLPFPSRNSSEESIKHTTSACRRKQSLLIHSWTKD
jgi:hypothetical protein